jgi:hypothetical protein
LQITITTLLYINKFRKQTDKYFLSETGDRESSRETRKVWPIAEKGDPRDNRRPKKGRKAEI